MTEIPGGAAAADEAVSADGLVSAAGPVSADVPGGTVPPRVTLLTRSSCQLCPPARQAVARACAEAGARWAEVDIGSDREMLLEFGDRIPVVLLDGEEFASLAIDPDEVAAALHA